jgi:pimeloyl-ACP methyl ester carboxylesterase
MMRTFLLCLALLLGSREVLADSLKVDGRRYDYLTYAAPQPSVIIVAFHGFTGSGAVMAKQSRLHKRGAAAVVAYPSGYWNTWDSTPGSVDVHMAAKLIDTLRQKYGPLPVCVTGISAGASMAWRVAAEVPVNAMVAVAGPLNPAVGRPPARPRVLELQGDDDDMVPLKGGKGMFGKIPPAQAGIDLFRANGSQAELRVIPGGQHLWDLGVGYDTTGEVLRFCGAKMVAGEPEPPPQVGGSDLPATPGVGITLYEGKGFTGRAMTFDGPVPDLSVYGLQGMVSSLQAPDAWYVCTKPKYKGDCTKTKGDVNLSSAWNDRIASLRPVN